MEQTALTCKTHNQQACAILFSSNASSSLLKCIMCVVAENLNPQELIPLPIILNKDCSDFCPALLQLETKQQQEKLKFLQENCRPEELNNLRKQIGKFFDNFKEQIIEKINIQQKKELLKIDALEQQYTMIFQLCKAATQTDDIEKILKSSYQNQDILNEQLRSLFLKMKSEMPSRQQQIIEDLEFLQQFNQKSSEQIQKAVIDLLEGLVLIEEKNQGDIRELELVKSTIEQTVQAVISKNSSGYQVIKNSIIGRVVLYSNFILNPKEKYELLVDVTNSKSPYRGFQLIGLVDDLTKDSKPLHQVALAFCSCITEYGCTKKIKGEQFMRTLQQKDRFQVQISICLEDRTFVACDYPERNSIYSIPQENIILANSYRLGVEMYQPDQIEILSFKKVPFFDTIF